MIKFPIAKVNLGLNIVERRDDGYHNLETVFYPVPITDALEVLPMDERFPIGDDCTIALSGIGVKGEVMDNPAMSCRGCISICINISLRRRAWVAARAMLP